MNRWTDPAGSAHSREHMRDGSGIEDGDLEVGGAGLAADCIELDLVDEYHLFVCPVIVGGGKPFFPPTDASLELELLETRSFASRVVYLRYARSRRD